MVKFKKLHPNAEIPTRATPGSSGYDVKAVSDPKLVHSPEGEDFYYYVEYETGLAAQVPDGWEIQGRCRSSISKKALYLCNSIATLDSDYTGQIIIRFRIDTGCALEAEESGVKPSLYRKGDKIIQLVFTKVEHPEIIEVEELSETERGAGSFGSSGA